MRMKHVVYPVVVAILLALLYKHLSGSVQKHLCALAFCVHPIFDCILEPECKSMLECLAECGDEQSQRRIGSAKKYHHLQFPQDRALCDYECLGLMTSQAGQDMVECVGSHGCMVKSDYSDECAELRQEDVLPFSAIKDILQGQWTKVFTNGWDIWPCQQTQFHPPLSSTPEPEPWMTAWPHESNVWRMDMSWAFQPDKNARRFQMSNEMYPNQGWPPTTAEPTLKTTARMWGTVAEENWYLLFAEDDMMLWYVCAYTIQVESYDSLTFVLLKDGRSLTDDMAHKIQQRARDILGDNKFGTMLRVREDCDVE